MIHPETIIKEVRITEKAATLQANLNQYTFEVFPRANRRSIAAAVEALFDVKVTRVNIINTLGKTKRSRIVRGAVGKQADAKKAIVTLQEGDSINLV